MTPIQTVRRVHHRVKAFLFNKSCDYTDVVGLNAQATTQAIANIMTMYPSFGIVANDTSPMDSRVLDKGVRLCKRYWQRCIQKPQQVCLRFERSRVNKGTRRHADTSFEGNPEDNDSELSREFSRLLQRLLRIPD